VGESSGINGRRSVPCPAEIHTNIRAKVPTSEPSFTFQADNNSLAGTIAKRDLPALETSARAAA